MRLCYITAVNMQPPTLCIIRSRRTKCLYIVFIAGLRERGKRVVQIWPEQLSSLNLVVLHAGIYGHLVTAISTYGRKCLPQQSLQQSAVNLGRLSVETLLNGDDRLKLVYVVWSHGSHIVFFAGVSSLSCQVWQT